MTTSDDATKNGSEESADQAEAIEAVENVEGTAAETTPETEEKKETAKCTGGGLIIFTFIAGLVISLIVGWIIFPKLLYSKKDQPINFNHKLHLEEVDNSCESCHFFREDGTYAGVPTLAQCIDCHEEVEGDSPDEERFVNEYVAKNKEVPWLIYSRQPDCVFFSHAAHVKGAGMDCQTCHGEIGESESLKPYEENRVTGYSRDIWGKNISGITTHTWESMKMDDCAKCHAEAKVEASSVQTKKDACFVCHK
ncbi:MAG: cytochrome c family protein [Desulfobacterales bacterium]|nr:cytochrome c family protein [Desulfobacterales bacterium]